ncbi:hypothetical protein AcW1_000933 [Taiwanofungus camphoratus]|nr:hypothetical protein AcW1_000933 [Antrodia cinnamomea]
MMVQVDLEDLSAYDRHVRSESTWNSRLAFLNARLRRLLLVAFTSLSVLSIIAFASVSLLEASPQSAQVASEPTAQSPVIEATSSLSTSVPHAEEYTDKVSYSPYVLGPPTQRFRDNLRNDTKYITSWISAGWTNDVMTYANLIYLGVITDRIPIIAMFTPSHIGDDGGTIAFGEVFDVPRFIKDSGIHIIEWDEVKDLESQELENIGCWNIWEAVQYREHFPRRSGVPGLLGLDISYTRAPDWVKMIPDYEHDSFSTFWTLARLAFPEERTKNLGEPFPSPEHQARLEPDDQVLCYDYLYYVCAQQSFEFEYDYAPAWRYVARHFRWTQQIEDIVALYVRHALSLPRTAELPPYIAVHVRHGDFRNWCWDAETPEDCFAPISVIARRVGEVQEELRERKGIDIPSTRVIVTSDEQDPTWWDEIKSLGWVAVDHNAMETEQTYGKWYPVFLDAAIQSNALGFVGTDRSTFSILSRRRVHDWHDGATRTVKWGRKDADAH